MSLALNPLTRMFRFFETSYQPGFIALSKLTANVIPRTAITRNSTERKEVLFNELTQGSTLFAALPLTSAISNPIQAKLAGVSAKLIKQRNADAVEFALKESGELLANQVKLTKLGKSIGSSLFIASLLISTTYLRNYRTIKRTGFSDYKQIVGLGGKKEPTAEDRRKANLAMQKNLNIIKGLITGGAVAWASVMAGAGLLARRGGAVFSPTRLFNPKRMQTLMKHWAFVGKNSNQINGLFNSKWQTLFVWGIPSFAGWFLGCRDKFEVIEQSSKFATFLAGYMVTPNLVKKYMQRKGQLVTQKYSDLVTGVANKSLDAVQAKQLIGFKNKQWAMLSATNFAVAGVLPLVMNIFFSKWRAKRMQPSETNQATFGQSAPAQYSAAISQLFRRPEFQQWGQRSF